jgi:hypothetical protein
VLRSQASAWLSCRTENSLRNFISALVRWQRSAVVGDGLSPSGLMACPRVVVPEWWSPSGGPRVVRPVECLSPSTGDGLSPSTPPSTPSRLMACPRAGGPRAGVPHRVHGPRARGCHGLSPNARGLSPSIKYQSPSIIPQTSWIRGMSLSSNSFLGELAHASQGSCSAIRLAARKLKFKLLAKVDSVGSKQAWWFTFDLLRFSVAW